MYDMDRCLKCKYSAKLNENEWCCAYILATHKRRGCYGSGDCEKFEPRPRGRRNNFGYKGVGYGEQ